MRLPFQRRLRSLCPFQRRLWQCLSANKLIALDFMYTIDRPLASALADARAVLSRLGRRLESLLTIIEVWRGQWVTRCRSPAGDDATEMMITKKRHFHPRSEREMHVLLFRKLALTACLRDAEPAAYPPHRGCGSVKQHLRLFGLESSSTVPSSPERLFAADL